jgi:hypothetical protein
VGWAVREGEGGDRGSDFDSSVREEETDRQRNKNESMSRIVFSSGDRSHCSPPPTLSPHQDDWSHRLTLSDHSTVPTSE